MVLYIYHMYYMVQCRAAEENHFYVSQYLYPKNLVASVHVLCTTTYDVKLLILKIKIKSINTRHNRLQYECILLEI